MIRHLNPSGIRFKAMALTSAMVILAATLAIAIVHWQVSGKMVQEERAKVGQAAQISSIHFESDLDTFRRDVLVLANMPPVPGLMRANANGGIDPLDGSSTALWKSRLAEIFVQTQRNKPAYKQIRLIGIEHNGREIVRVDRIGESTAVVSEARLQNKADRDYFKEGIALHPGQTRISELNLNRENGQVEIPALPVVRVMTPAYTPDGQIFGIVVVNVDMRTVLGSLTHLIDADTSFYVANGRGDFLVHPEQEKTFAFEFGNSYRMRDEFPEFDRVFMSSNANGVDGILDDITARKLVLGIQDIPLNADLPERFLRFVHAVSYDSVVASATVSNMQLAQVTMAVFLLTVPCALFFGSALIKPLSEVSKVIAAYAPGDDLRDLPAYRQDEIGMLSKSFVRMVQDVEERRLALQIEVSERRRAQNGTKASEARYIAAIELMRDAHIISDSKGVIQSFNGGGEQIFGYSRDEVIGQNVSMLLPEQQQDAHYNYVDSYHRTGQSKIIGIGRNKGLFGRRKDGSTIALSLLLEKLETAEGIFFTAIIRDISHQLEVEEKNRRLTAVVEQATDCIVVLNVDGVIEYVNPQFEREFAFRADGVVGKKANEMEWALSRQPGTDDLLETMGRGEVWSGHCTIHAKDGTKMDHDVTVSPISDAAGTITHYVQFRRNVTERLKLEQQLGQAQKLESIGQLAAGIAHEINTPTQYVGDNTRFVKDAFDDVGELFTTLTELTASPDGSLSAEVLAKALAKADVEYLKEEVPRALEQSLEGVERVTKIVRAMKEFSHPAQEKTPVDLHAAIQSTITVASNEWKYVAELTTDFDPAMPPVTCLPGEFNQVILNIIVNAAHAIIDVVGDAPAEKGGITIITRRLNGWAEIRIADTGAGMPENVKARIFDPFFTTKEVGKGTGQGLSIAHNVVVDKHGGTIEVNSKPGEGTCFTIRLPLEDPASVDATVAA